MIDECAINELLDEIESLLGTLGKHHATSVYDRLKVIRLAINRLKYPSRSTDGSIRDFFDKHSTEEIIGL